MLSNKSTPLMFFCFVYPSVKIDLIQSSKTRSTDTAVELHADFVYFVKDNALPHQVFEFPTRPAVTSVHRQSF